MSNNSVTAFQQKPPMMGQIISQMGSVSALLNLGILAANHALAPAVKAFQAMDYIGALQAGSHVNPAMVAMWNFFNNPLFKNIFGSVTAFMSAYSIFEGVQGMFKTG